MAKRRKYYYDLDPVQNATLTNEQAERKDKLRGLQLASEERQGFVERPASHVRGAHWAGGTPVVPLDAGKNMRYGALPREDLSKNIFKGKFYERFIPDRVRDQLSQQFTMPLGEVPAHSPFDNILARSNLDHERGERATSEAAQALAIGSRPFASHLGELPDVAERQSLFQSPEASAVLDAVRANNPDDAFNQKKMKQFGHTASYPMPMGGRQQRALAGEMAKYTPKVEAGQTLRSINSFKPRHDWRQKLLDENKSGLTLIPYSPTGIQGQRTKMLLQGGQQVARTTKGLLQNIPGLSEYVQRASPHVKNIFANVDVKPDQSAEFLRHFSSLRR